MDEPSGAERESRFPVVREQLTSWRRTRDRSAWRRVWLQARCQAWRENRLCRSWRSACFLGLMGVVGGSIWLVVARADWRPMALLLVSLVFAVVAGSQHLRHIDRIACRLLSSRDGKAVGPAAVPIDD